MSRRPHAILIAGPTASGKSALALALAREVGGAIVNVDSMQVYRDLRILTARPSPADEALAPHFLYGVIDAAERCSAGRWARMAADALAEIEKRGLVPIFVGGTGLYFRALTEGLSDIPDVPAEARAEAQEQLARLGPAGFHALLADRDPDSARLIRPSDRQRLIRAWELLTATGHGLAWWQKQPRRPLLGDLFNGPVARAVLAVPRGELHRRIEARFDAMLAAGALEEVRALHARGLEPALPAMKAVGVSTLISHLEGEIPIEEAAAQVKTATRRYARRQETWFRHQMADWPRIAATAPEEIYSKMMETVAIPTGLRKS